MSASINGVEAVPVSVEVSIGPGLPGMSIVGMGDTAIQEAKERVRSAIKASGFTMPNEKIVVNLAPGGIKKIGAGFDLPIALGILAATKQIDPSHVQGKLVVGELSLYGEVSCVSGDLAFCICASRSKLDYLSAMRHRAPIESIKQLCLDRLSMLRQDEPFVMPGRDDGVVSGSIAHQQDYAEVSGHECAKRALEIAVAGRHGLLMIGPPGSGKTMLASRIPTIMPRLTQDEMLETASIHSVAGECIDGILKGIPPYRHPHHSATMAGLLGGGAPLRPGEASLAHNGVLFLDELAEFKPATLQGLRQPMEDGSISITRACGKVRVPSRFILVAATNPCPCGHFGDSDRECKCTYSMVGKYMARIGGPLIDRFDMQLDIHRIPSNEFFGKGGKVSSTDMQEHVIACRRFSSWRKSRENDRALRKGPNSAVAHENEMLEDFSVDANARSFVRSISEEQKLSGRAIKATLKVSRTIADMEESENVRAEHIAEAHAFRMSEIIGGR